MGYLLVDHTASLPSVQQQYGKKKECDTVACKHCGAVIRVMHRQPQGAWCRLCSGPVCDTPACATRCTPFFAKIEQHLARERYLASLQLNE